MKKNTIVFDGGSYDYLMRANGFSCGLNMPPALSGESTFGLPPYAKRMPYLVDKYPACPDNWMRSEGKIKSYFVPVLEDHGMWLDFNENSYNKRHVAIVISIQGVNPITGLPCRDAHLEQYVEECPKHNIKFGPDRYCKKCDYKWPKQNYITTTTTPTGSLWLDGFRSVDGIVRQYILTAEKMRGVATNVKGVGKDRVYAIGLSFFLSKEKKPEPKIIEHVRGTFFSPCYTGTKWLTKNIINEVDDNDADSYLDMNDVNAGGKILYGDSRTNKNVYLDSASINVCSSSSSSVESASSASNEPIERLCAPRTRSVKTKGVRIQSIVANADDVTNSCTTKIPIQKIAQTKKLEVGAGAKIRQSIYDDCEKLDYWHDEPENIICISYCEEKDAKKIIESGEVEINGHAEGFLKEIPVGN